jgi:hypothetical protein
MLCADRAQSELRQSTAFSWRHSGQRYTDQATPGGFVEKSKCLAHSLVSDNVFFKTLRCKSAFGEHSLATGLATVTGKRRN